MSKQYLEMDGSIFVDRGVTVEKFIKDLSTWGVEDIEIEDAEIDFDEECGKNLLYFYVDFYTDLELCWEDPAPGVMGYGEICYIENGWRDKNDATKDVIDFITSFGYRLYKYKVNNFDDGADYSPYDDDDGFNEMCWSPYDEYDDKYDD